MEGKVSDLNQGTRKRKLNPEKWKRNIEKRQLYSPSKPCVRKTSCNHEKGSAYLCNYLEKQTILDFYNSFYRNRKKVDQDRYALNYIRDATTHKKGKSPVRNSLKYFIPTPSGDEQICAAAFSEILRTNVQRFQRLFRKFKALQQFPEEKRGGYRKSAIFDELKQTVVEFISRLPGCEAHYGRQKSKRVYLASTLNVKKLWKLYQSQTEDQKVTYGYFLSTFNQSFNLSFKSPATDLCAMCTRLTHLIQVEKGLQKKQELKKKLRNHKTLAACFYKRLKRPSATEMVFAMDCEKTQALPKLAIGAAYFKRQLGMANFTIVRGGSRVPLNPENVILL